MVRDLLCTRRVKKFFCFVVSLFAYTKHSKGIRIEAVGSIRPDTIQHVVPSALPTNDVFTQVLDMEEGELYAFTIVDTSGNGIQTAAAPSKLYSCRSRNDGLLRSSHTSML